MSIERNAPCPCGSGKKYKKCCWLVEQSKVRFFEPSVSGSLGLDRKRLIERMIDWAAQRFRSQIEASWRELSRAFAPDEVALLTQNMDASSGLAVLSTDYFCHSFNTMYRDVETTPLRHFLAHSGPMASTDRAFFERLERSNLRAFRVVGVALDNIEIVDLIARTGPRMRVFCSASFFAPQNRIVARLIEANDRLEFAMVLHLNIFNTKDVQDTFKDELKQDPTYLALNSIQTGKPIRGRDQDLAREMVQEMLENPDEFGSVSNQLEQVMAEALERTLYSLWLDDLLIDLEKPRMVFAGTGEAIALHEDDYDVLDHPALLRILRTQTDVDLPVVPMPSSAMRATLVDGKIPEMGRPRSTINFDGAHKLSLFHPTKGLHLEGKTWFDGIAGNTVRFRQTRVTYPGDALSSAPNVASISAQASKKSTLDQAELMKSPELQNAVIALVKKQYATWTTDQIPALKHKTPKQLMSTKPGRDKVRELLFSYEQGSGSADLGIPIDYQFLWDALGLLRVE